MFTYLLTYIMSLTCTFPRHHLFPCISLYLRNGAR